MKEITRQWFQLTRDPRIEHTERTLASYIFQEKEAISRNAKIAWCTQKGHKVHNLQHDGIIVSLARNADKHETGREMERISGNALGYPQPVSVDK